MNNKIKLVVFDEYILGYILPEYPNYVQVLHESVLKGGCRTSTVIRSNMYIHSSSDIRLASANDFDDYRCVFGSFANKDKYEYQENNK